MRAIYGPPSDREAVGVGRLVRGVNGARDGPHTALAVGGGAGGGAPTRLLRLVCSAPITTRCSLQGDC